MLWVRIDTFTTLTIEADVGRVTKNFTWVNVLLLGKNKYSNGSKKPSNCLLFDVDRQLSPDKGLAKDKHLMSQIMEYKNGLVVFTMVLFLSILFILSTERSWSTVVK